MAVVVATVVGGMTDGEVVADGMAIVVVVAVIVVGIAVPVIGAGVMAAVGSDVTGAAKQLANRQAAARDKSGIISAIRFIGNPTKTWF